MSIAIFAPASWYDPSEMYEDREPEDDPEMDSLEDTQPWGEIITLEDWQERQFPTGMADL